MMFIYESNWSQIKNSTASYRVDYKAFALFATLTFSLFVTIFLGSGCLSEACSMAAGERANGVSTFQKEFFQS